MAMDSSHHLRTISSNHGHRLLPKELKNGTSFWVEHEGVIVDRFNGADEDSDDDGDGTNDDNEDEAGGVPVRGRV